jgi:hypothetical protein
MIGIASLVDAFHVPKLLSQQLIPFGRSGDGLEVLTFGVVLVFRSVRKGRTVRVPVADGPRLTCSSCSCSASLSIRFGFVLWLEEVSDGPQQRRAQSAGAWRTVRVLPVDGPFFGVRY